MDSTRLAPTVGIALCLLFLVVLALPFVLIDSGVGTYYATGALNPLFAGLFALVSLIVFAAGREERTDPAIAAGAALVFGLFTLVFALVWTLTLPIDLVLQLTTIAAFEFHRFAVVAVALSLLVAAGWYVRALRLV